MAGLQVRALYDFEGEPGSAELSIFSGEILQVTRKDAGEGWWEGTNKDGKTGLFPAAYVEELSASHALHPSAIDQSSSSRNQDLMQVQDQPAMGGFPPDGNFGDDSSGNQYAQQGDSQDFWDDDWDDDSEGGSTSRGQTSGTGSGGHTYLTRPGSFGDDASIGKGDGKTTVKRLNRFSFVKSGVENYVLGTAKTPVTDADKVFIQETEEGVIWNPISEPYSCIVASPKKESKLKGLKSFIAYQLTPTFNNIQVSRRYKHFDWLHERLVEKFCLLAIPPLPDKQISGRYEEIFIEHRRMQLQAFVDYVCKHPILSQCWVWQHFITCTDEKRWKAGKRRAEKDEIVGANSFLALIVPEKAMDPISIELRSDNFARYVHEMDLAVKNLMVTSVDQAKKHQGPYKREFQRVGQSFLTLAQAAKVDEAAGQPNYNLSSALKVTGETYNEIGGLFEEQPKADWEPLSDVLHIYKGLLGSFPDILNFHKDALQKRKDCEKLTTDHKMDTIQFQELNRRTDVVSYALMAEINHFHKECANDFKKAMRSFLIEQIAFYERVVNKMKEALTAFDE